MENLRRKTQKMFSLSLSFFNFSAFGKINGENLQNKNNTENVGKTFVLSNVYYYLFFYVIVFVLENYFFPNTQVQFRNDVNVGGRISTVK